MSESNEKLVSLLLSPARFAVAARLMEDHPGGSLFVVEGPLEFWDFHIVVDNDLVASVRSVQEDGTIGPCEKVSLRRADAWALYNSINAGGFSYHLFGPEEEEVHLALGRRCQGAGRVELTRHEAFVLLKIATRDGALPDDVEGELLWQLRAPAE